MPQPNPSDTTDVPPAQASPSPSPTPTVTTTSSSRGRMAVNWRKTARAVAGTVLILLGLLWILQGVDVVRIRPILCVAECQPVTGGSAAWLAIGVVTVAVGLMVVGVRRRRRS